MDEYWIWLTQVKGIGPILQKKLLDRFGSPERIYLASGTELMTIAGISEKTVEKIQASRSLGVKSFDLQKQVRTITSEPILDWIFEEIMDVAELETAQRIINEAVEQITQ